MKLTKHFWAWVGQMIAANLLLWRLDLIASIFNLIPNVDLSQFNLEMGVARIAAFVWILWLVWRGIDGFYRTQDFILDL